LYGAGQKSYPRGVQRICRAAPPQGEVTFSIEYRHRRPLYGAHLSLALDVGPGHVKRFLDACSIPDNFADWLQMTPPERNELSAAEELAAVYDRRAEALRRAIGRYQQGGVPSILAALCDDALSQRVVLQGAGIEDAHMIADAITAAIGDQATSVDYLISAQPLIFGGRTPFKVIADGELPLLIYSLGALQHGLGA
jgi:hypothetical protein